MTQLDGMTDVVGWGVGVGGGGGDNDPHRMCDTDSSSAITALLSNFQFFCDAQRKGDHIQPRGSRRVSLLCLLCSGPLGGEQLIPSIIIGLPAAHYSLSPLFLQRLLHTLWIVVDADKRKTRSRFSSFRGKEDKSLGKGEETVVATPGLEFHGISRHKFDEPQSNKSTLLF